MTILDETRYRPFTDYFEGYIGQVPGRTKVHVAGWNRGCVFFYQGTENGRHKLTTPSKGKIYYTTNRLIRLKDS